MRPRNNFSFTALSNFFQYESCETCQRQTRLKTMAPHLKPIKVVGPWHMVGMDLIGPLKTTPQGNKYILTLTDYFTKFVDFYALPTKSGEAVAKALETFFLRCVFFLIVYYITVLYPLSQKLLFTLLWATFTIFLRGLVKNSVKQTKICPSEIMFQQSRAV